MLIFCMLFIDARHNKTVLGIIATIVKNNAISCIKYSLRCQNM